MGGDCREARQRRAVPSGFRYAEHSDEPKAENTRGEALLFSWSHLHGIDSPCRDSSPLPGKTRIRWLGFAHLRGFRQGTLPQLCSEKTASFNSLKYIVE
jgi:hypothetical protein